MTFTRRSVIPAVLIAGAAVAFFLREGPPRAAPPEGGAAIIAFGDSLVEGRGTTAGGDFVSVLSKRLRVRIVNAGRSGDTTRSALERLDRDVLSRNPRIVLVLLGGNDALRRVPARDTFGNLGTIVERIRARGAAVVLIGISPGVFSDPYADEYEQLARRTAAGLVPDILDGIFGRADLMADTIHPNDRGHQLIADRVEPVLRELLAAGR